MIGLPIDSEPRQKKAGAAALTALVLFVILFGTNLFGSLRIWAMPSRTDGICPLPVTQRPKAFAADNSTVLAILHDPEYRNLSVNYLSKAVQVDTQVFDSPPLVKDDPEYWAKFAKFHRYLEATFPRVYKHLEVVKVNTYGLVFYWKGSHAALKPVMLTAHQDVVPVQKETLHQWAYPPFEGHYDGTYVYGRGAGDCKNVLVLIMESLDLLLQQKFQPKRGIVVALGFDEEVSGFHGAQELGKYLLDRFGPDGIFAIVDEGSTLTYDATTGRVVAPVGTGEKGYVDIDVGLTTPGGHSSVPPEHTSIGIMGELAYIIEKDPYSPIFTEKNPVFGYMQCIAVHAGDRLPRSFRKSILRSGFDKLANSRVVEALVRNRATQYLIGTSQAEDIVRGGEKNNALPESTHLLVNHRVAIESDVQLVMDHFAARVVELAKKHGLGVDAWGKEVLAAGHSGKFEVTIPAPKLESAPVSPPEGKSWELLAGVTRHVYEDLVFPDSKEPVIVAPAIMTGNTDTRHYWPLTKNIYRFTPLLYKDVMAETHIHSVDERQDMDNHLRVVAFFYQYLQAASD